MWDFTKIPPDQRDIAREYYYEGNFFKLMDLYNEHKVSPHYLTACCSIEKMLEWTKWALVTKKI